MKKREDKLYERKVWIPLSDGTKKRKSFYNKDKRLLDIEVNEIENQIIKGTYVLDSDSTFEQNIKKWFNVHASQKEETTQESYSIYMNHAIRLIGNKKLQDIKPMDIQQMYNAFVNETDKNGNLKHSANSLRHLHAVVNMSCKFAVENNILYRNPCETQGKKIKVPEFKPYVYTEDEFNKLMGYIEGTEAEVIVLLAGGIGLRAGEICGLKWSDVDRENYTISIKRSRYRVTGKTGDKKPKSKNSDRVIPVDPYVIEILDKHPNQSDYVLCRSTNNPYRNDEVYHKFVEVVQKHNMPTTRLHDLRHYNATMMAYYGIDVKTAAGMLGDDPVTVLQIYQHVQDKMGRNAAEKMGGMFKNKKDKPVVRNVVNEEKEKDLSTTYIVSNPSLN